MDVLSLFVDYNGIYFFFQNVSIDSVLFIHCWTWEIELGIMLGLK